MKQLLIGGGIIFGLVAAGIWIYATKAQVAYHPRTDSEGWTEAAIIRKEGNREIDIIATLDAQTLLNRWAAIATAASVLCQLAATISPN